MAAIYEGNNILNWVLRFPEVPRNEKGASPFPKTVQVVWSNWEIACILDCLWHSAVSTMDQSDPDPYPSWTFLVQQQGYFGGGELLGWSDSHLDGLVGGRSHPVKWLFPAQSDAILSWHLSAFAAAPVRGLGKELERWRGNEIGTACWNSGESCSLRQSIWCSILLQVSLLLLKTPAFPGNSCWGFHQAVNRLHSQGFFLFSIYKSPFFPNCSPPPFLIRVNWL